MTKPKLSLSEKKLSHLCPPVGTVNRISLTWFVKTKPMVSVVITKPLASQRSLCACKASWLEVF